jgi:hypothetical protein
MSPVSASEPKAAGHAHWVVEPYGAPGETSEVSRITGFYTAEALTVFGACVCGPTEAAQDAVAFDKAA